VRRSVRKLGFCSAAAGRFTGWGRRSVSGEQRAMALKGPADDLHAYESPLVPLALWRMYQGRLEEARTLFEALYGAAGERGEEFDALYLRGRLVDVALRGGRWRDADTHAAELYELSEQIGLEYSAGLSDYWKALCDAHLGRSEQARATAEGGASLARATKAHNTLVMNLGCSASSRSRSATTRGRCCI
jgi:hypothetical protein